MIQDCASSNKIKENKYKILRMSLLLGSDENREETLNNFEDASREIDAMNDEVYLKNLENKFYDTLTLEEEEKKLAELVDYIGGRVEQRISLLSDFANVTGFDLMNLPPIKYYDKLDDYKDRLKYIREYLSNTKQINTLNQEIGVAEEKLKKAYMNKATSEECNSRNEEILLNKFVNIVKSKEEFQEVDVDNIDRKLNDVIAQVEESRKSLDIFTKSFTTLRGSGISEEEEQEYLSYVDNAKEVYYVNKEQEYLLRLYQLLLKKELEYGNIVLKRDAIHDLLCERMELRKNLNIEEFDLLNGLYDLLDRQYEDIKRQKDNMNDIEFLTEEIDAKKAQVNDLELDNQKVEILALLREFCMIDTYDDTENTVDAGENHPAGESTETVSDVSSVSTVVEPEVPTVSKEDNNTNQVIEKQQDVSSDLGNHDIFSAPSSDLISEEKKVEEESAKDNQVVTVMDAKGIDLELVHLKASKVMQRVGEMLGIKSVDTKIVSVTNDSVASENSKGNVFSKEVVPSPDVSENPLFNNHISDSEEQTSSQSEPEVDQSFWFSSDTPDALNELPDLSSSNNNFFSNNMPDLNFPDLKLDFGNQDSEGV